MKKVIVTMVVLGLLALLGWQIHLRYVEQSSVGQGGRGDRAVPVEATPVATRTMRDVVEFTGTLAPASQFTVAPKVQGRLEKLMVNIGDTVKSGDLLAVLDSAEYAQNVAQARAELEVSKASLADARTAMVVAQSEYQRVKDLHAEKVASDAELEQATALLEAAKARHEVAKAQIQQREAALKAAEVRLAYTTIHVTWEDGASRVVAERFVDEGEMLRANDPIVTILDTVTLLAVINVIERDFPAIALGQEATIVTDAYPDKTFKGKVLRKAPILQEASRQARVELVVPNTDGSLAPGMFIRARIEFAERTDATAVPSGCLVQRDGKLGLFKVDAAEMKAVFVPVTVGIVDGEWTEIVQPKLDGLVVTLGQHLLTDGSSLVLPGERRKGKPSGDDTPIKPEKPAAAGGASDAAGMSSGRTSR